MRKSTVGPWIAVSAPPAYSNCTTFLPPRSADWPIDSAWGTPALKALVLLPNGWPLTWNVLFVDPWTPGHAPVARLYQPAPVFGGAWVSRPPPEADDPFFRSSANAGRSLRPWVRVALNCSTRS